MCKKGKGKEAKPSYTGHVLMENRNAAVDVHQASTSVAVHDSEGKVLMQSTIKTTPEALRDLIRGLSGSVHLTF
ncbi:MAG: hypothetical protein DMF61_26400 [Blastocatellia bacterium AA13]|nr:MAG: hypothetical protein DMF61_26400 [Blastocatellia bacterium AA13]